MFQNVDKRLEVRNVLPQRRKFVWHAFANHEALAAHADEKRQCAVPHAAWLRAWARARQFDKGPLKVGKLSHDGSCEPTRVTAAV